MGNQNSRASKSNDDKETEDMKFENVISYIAAKYITTASFQDLQNLHKPEYCNTYSYSDIKLFKMTKY